MSGFFKRNRTVLIIAVVIAAAVGGWIYTRRGIRETATTFQTATVERGNLTATIGATGTVRAKQTAALIWMAAGTVDVVNVQAGDNVPADFVMAYLKKTSLPQSIILAEADLASAQMALDDLINSDTALAEAVIALRDAQSEYDRAVNYRKELEGKIHIKEIKYRRFGNQLVPFLKEYRGYADETTKKKADEKVDLTKAKLEDIQREFDRLSAGNKTEIVAAQARVDAAQAALNMARIVAPFSGIVTESLPLSGDQVGAGAAAFRLDDLSRLYVDVEVSEVDINSVQIGQPVTLTFDAILGRDYQGEVVEVAEVGVVSSGVVNFKVTAELTSPDDLVKPGMTAAVDITVKELNDVVVIPNRAVRLVDGVRYVYVLDGSGQPERKRIVISSSSDQQSAIADGEVAVGDAIILNPPVEFGGPGGGGPGGGPFGGN